MSHSPPGRVLLLLRSLVVTPLCIWDCFCSVPFPARIGKYDPIKGSWTIEPRDKRVMNPHQGGTASVPFPPRIGKYNPIRAEWCDVPHAPLTHPLFLLPSSPCRRCMHASRIWVSSSDGCS